MTFTGGLTAAVVALPLAMAMGIASGVGPIAGMYGAIFVGFFAAIFGGTPAQVSGPTGPMTVVMAAIFVQYTGMFPDDPAQGAALAFTVVMMGGLFQIVFGILKTGEIHRTGSPPCCFGFYEWYRCHYYSSATWPPSRTGQVSQSPYSQRNRYRNIFRSSIKPHYYSASLP